MFGSKDKAKDRLQAEVSEALGAPDWLESVTIDDDGGALLVLKLGDLTPTEGETRRMEAEAIAERVKGVNSAKSILTAERQTGSSKQLNLDKSPPRRGKSARKGRPALSKNLVAQGTPTRKPPSEKLKLNGVDRVLLVASAKGGVGKSTIAVNLAVAMAKSGMNVGLMDADIYGPSVPTMVGMIDEKPEADENNKLIPVEAHGLKTLSIGYLSRPDMAMIWRGPMVMSAISQMIGDADWTAGTGKPLDILIVDTPPGTGDAQLTLAQKVPVDAALLVTTPQDVALADVRRGAAMFEKVGIPVIGIAETMSFFEDPSGNKHYLMGNGGGQKMADALNIPLLAEIPLDQAIREGGDIGIPAAIEGSAAEQFTGLAKAVARELDALAKI